MAALQDRRAEHEAGTRRQGVYIPLGCFGEVIDSEGDAGKECA